jgi:DNA repair photolyase
MAAARQLKELGWRVRIRIDPMFRGWDYSQVLRDVRELGPERVTLGCLRAEPHLLQVIEQGLFSELEPPAEKGGLARYPLATRLEVYGRAVKALKDVCPIGLCEETRDVWDALGLDADSECCNCGD